jgi:hypothetical protein
MVRQKKSASFVLNNVMRNAIPVVLAKILAEFSLKAILLLIAIHTLHENPTKDAKRRMYHPERS